VHRRLDRSLGIRDLEQLRVELHERMLDSGIFIVTAPAVVFARRGSTRRFCRVTETEVSPLIREAGFILHFDVQAHEQLLIAPFLVDRAVRAGTVNLQNEHGFVWPLAIGLEVVIRLGSDEHVRKGGRAISSCVRAVAHTETGGYVDPSAIVCRTDKFAVRSKLRGRGELRGGRRCRSSSGVAAAFAQRNSSRDQDHDHKY
jgi:hypothetical protein